MENTPKLEIITVSIEVIKHQLLVSSIAQELLKKMLKRDGFIATEEDVFTALVQWLKNSTSGWISSNKRKEKLIIDVVDLSNMTIEQLTGTVWGSGLVSESTVLAAVKVVNAKLRIHGHCDSHT